jgi:hypothetical protein
MKFFIGDSPLGGWKRFAGGHLCSNGCNVQITAQALLAGRDARRPALCQCPRAGDFDLPHVENISI